MAGNDIAEIKRVFDLQKNNVINVRKTSAEERKAKLLKLRAVVLANAETVRDALYADLRRPKQDVFSPELCLDVAAVIGDIDDAVANLDAWMAPVEVTPSPMFAGARTYIGYEPKGVCLLFGPWNFPFLLTFQPLVPIIAAGNCAIVKPNELTPVTSQLIARLIRETFDEKEIAVFEGGVELANSLLELPVDHVFFTGSPAVGKIIMGAAARHLASVTLELGGKCPAIIDSTADIADAATKIGLGRTYNAGQICLAPDHVWIQEDVKDQFLQAITGLFESFFYVDGALNKESLGKIVDDRNFARVKGYLDDAISRGATVVTGGKVDAADRTIYPTVLTNVPLDATVMRDEIFGPILPVLTYKDPEEVFSAIRRGGKPLAAYIFSKDKKFVDLVQQNTNSGGVTVNGVIMHAIESQLPFGGVKESGCGRYHGIHGFRELSHERAVLELP